MPYLLKNIKATLLDNFQGSVDLIGNISGTVGLEDYVKVNSLEAFVQNFGNVVEVSELPAISQYGYKSSKNIIELEISY